MKYVISCGENISLDLAQQGIMCFQVECVHWTLAPGPAEVKVPEAAAAVGVALGPTSPQSPPHVPTGLIKPNFSFI